MKQLTALCLSLLSLAATAVAEVGEFSIPAVNPLNAAQLEALRELVKEDPEAGAIVHEIKQQALPLLDARPTPLEVIHYEGLLRPAADEGRPSPARQRREALPDLANSRQRRRAPRRQGRRGSIMKTVKQRQAR